ncbi:MAG TPA: right-handed parallel beta-helix repeat-containing protein [Kiritimatiellia bacterium]|nr:right-handed parallel beta-helix repeat-containing protein [Kiritimatiellia bacterium]HMP34060.1 right-handed parallel beta-helix repeat-containing protein [Kiritimatiellia bacterium]
MHCRRILAVVVAALAASGITAAPGPFPWLAQPLVILHVATNGNNTTGNGSLAAPFRTISRAAQSAAPGTEIRLHPGTHGGDTFLDLLRGTTNLPIWIRGDDPANRPLISGGTEGLHLSRARYVMLQNLEVANASANGINCDDGGLYADPTASAFLVFSNVVVRDIGSGGNQDGIKLSGVRDFYLFDVSASRCGGNASGSGVDLVGCHRGVIRRSSFSDLSANAVQIKGGSSDIEVSQCIISNAGQRGINIGGSTDFVFFRPPLVTNAPNVEAHSVRVFANVFIGGTATVAYVGATNCHVAHNTVIEPGRWVFRILQETVSSGGYAFAPCGANTFANNVVVYRHATLSSFVNQGANTAPSTFAVLNNLWYPQDNPGATPHALPGTVSGNRYGLNPAFLDTTARNYRITLASPAATGGVVRADAPIDRDGVAYLTPPSLGAYEVAGDVDADTLPDYWELASITSLVMDAVSDFDADGASNRDEWVADTHPALAVSRLMLLEASPAEEGLMLRWQGGRAATQFVETAASPSGPWIVCATNQPPTGVTNTWLLPAGASATWLRVRAAR